MGRTNLNPAVSETLNHRSQYQQPGTSPGVLNPEISGSGLSHLGHRGILGLFFGMVRLYKTDLARAIRIGGEGLDMAFVFVVSSFGGREIFL